ncbi:hypothetical protein C8J36_104133 [Rhizobium sp. PP-F2F-G48]|uniref:hypothetical protein n=1 Tax=Rhizobium sp. PP-F2F-G48 TaxID=2135651 RepID=UPI00104760AF|nr:hypothetical protein [Rhizobium sp. PP-F2F-G48]TCM54941.1 hypothetical protein C8J36_104133 [Rhizobium sp. PP-F2F-G48]
MTRHAHPASFLAFAVEVATFVEEIETAVPPAPFPLASGSDALLRSAFADAKRRHDGLFYVLVEEERARLEAAEGEYRPELRPYLEDVASRRIAEQSRNYTPIARTSRSIQAEVIAGVHFAAARNRAFTAKALNRGIPRAEMMFGFSPSTVRNALDSFVRPLIAQTEVLLVAVDLAASKATALLHLWQHLGGPGRALINARELMATGQILTPFRSVEERAIREPRPFARADAAERALNMLRHELQLRCEKGAVSDG